MEEMSNGIAGKIRLQSDARSSKIDECAWMSVHLPDVERRNGASVIILPGGGYQHLADDYEGVDCAEWMNSLGVTAFVLRYRLAPEYHHPSQLLDAQRAIRHVRANAALYQIDPHKIGIWGFSAGGHLASTAATHYDHGKSESDDPIEHVSCRPDFAILAYPVISLVEPYTHLGSRDNLLGTSSESWLSHSLSAEKNVTSDTPPAFIFHTDSDTGVSSENSVQFYLALHKAGVPAEMHIYADGPHGVGMAQDNPILCNWTIQLRNWLVSRRLVTHDQM
ncbi:MAG: alpha/beta hydrolase [Armatimonadota bacterium]